MGDTIINDDGDNNNNKNNNNININNNNSKEVHYSEINLGEFRSHVSPMVICSSSGSLHPIEV